MIGAAHISEDKLTITFVAEDVCPWPVFLHDRANHIRRHTVGNGIHLGMHLTIILAQRGGQYCSPLTAEGFEKLLVVIKHGFRLSVCEQQE